MAANRLGRPHLHRATHTQPLLHKFPTPWSTQLRHLDDEEKTDIHRTGWGECVGECVGGRGGGRGGGRERGRAGRSDFFVTSFFFDHQTDHYPGFDPAPALNCIARQSNVQVVTIRTFHTRAFWILRPSVEMQLAMYKAALE